MEMPGGWTHSMMWMRMPGQTWLAAAASFIGMWVAMMVAMMSPSLAPLLWRYRQALGVAGVVHRNWLTALVSLAYYAVWAMLGLIAFPLGAVVAAFTMRKPELARLVPIGVGAVVLVAGIVQYTAWKARHLAFCRAELGHGAAPRAAPGAAWRYGLCIGLHCVRSCAALTAVVLGLGVMDVRVMAAVTAVVTAEHLAPAGMRVARITGMLGVAAGLLLIVRAPWPL